MGEESWNSMKLLQELLILCPTAAQDGGPGWEREGLLLRAVCCPHSRQPHGAQPPGGERWENSIGYDSSSGAGKWNQVKN